ELSPAVQISAEGLVLPQSVVDAAERAFGKEQLQPITTYLANTMSIRDLSVPYSTVTGVDSTAALGPLLNATGEAVTVADDQIVLNSWAADRLNAVVGDTVTLRYFEPESTHGQLHEREPPLELNIVAIAELENLDGHATAAADPRLTPQLAGVTDQASIADWKLPFDLTEPYGPEDEDYWDDYSTTPKAFVSQELAKNVWDTRWGSVSLLRMSTEDGRTVESVADALRQELSPADFGFVFQPVKQQGLDAASGTTPFDGLFLGFSMFLIAAAILLLVLLFRLGIEGRASELGLLAALGFTPARARKFLSREALCVAVVGALAGLLLGTLYAGLMVTGLRTIWVAAVASPFLQLHVGQWSLPIGLALGIGVAWLATWWTLRQVLANSPQSLLSGVVSSLVTRPVSPAARHKLRSPLLLLFCLAIAGLLGVWGINLRGEAQAGAFFGVGSLVLTALLGLVNRQLKLRAAGRAAATTASLPKLALANLARRPGRSTLTIGLVASASFLLLAISAFRLAPSSEGTGGYDWFATSDLPLHYDLGKETGRLELGFSDREEKRLASCSVESLRIHGGEDASCLNLYQTSQPRVLGARDANRALSGFAWTAGGPTLDEDLGTDEFGRSIVPVVLDFNTAVYSLHLSGKIGDQLSITDADARDVTLEIVGLLKNSVLQGDLVVSDDHFRRLFPTDSGSRLFLIKSPVENVAEDSIDELLEDRLSDYGFAATSTAERLRSFLAVQNTYLSTFQSLGGLGLLLGTVGLAVVQLRGVIERRGELALLQAVGFRRRRIVLLVLIESLALLTLGLVLGSIAAVLALMPQLGIHQTTLPWQTIAWLLTTILAAGLATTWLATRGTLRQPILPVLRGD
ncbi:MAG: FtsX-like permease family protein, partial [Aeoliella sp.]